MATKRKTATANAAAPTTTPEPSQDIYKKAVAEVKDILARQDRDWRRIGEHVAAVGKAYGQDRVGKLAKDVGLAVTTLRRYRQVHERATEIEEKHALGRVLNYSAVRELLNHPDPAAVEAAFKSKPDTTKKDAQGIIQSLRKKDKANGGFRRKEIKRQLAALAETAKNAKRIELKLVKDPSDYRLLKELLNKHPKLATELREGGDALDHSADIIDHLDEHIADVELNGGAKEAAAREAARQRFEHERAKLVQGNGVTQSSADARKADNAATLETVL
jgi:hypothetical protein